MNRCPHCHAPQVQPTPERALGIAAQMVGRKLAYLKKQWPSEAWWSHFMRLAGESYAQHKKALS